MLEEERALWDAGALDAAHVLQVARFWEAAVPVEVDDVVEAGLRGELTAELVKGRRAKDIDADLVAVGTEQLQEWTGLALKGDVWEAVRALRARDNEQDIEGVAGVACRRVVDEVGLAADEGVGLGGEVTVRAGGVAE